MPEAGTLVQSTGGCPQTCGGGFTCESRNGTGTPRGIVRFTDRDFADWVGVDLNEVFFRRMDQSGTWRHCEWQDPSTPASGKAKASASGYVTVNNSGTVDASNAHYDYIDRGMAENENDCVCDDFADTCALQANYGTRAVVGLWNKCGGGLSPYLPGDLYGIGGADLFCTDPRSIAVGVRTLDLTGSGSVTYIDSGSSCGTFCGGGSGSGTYSIYHSTGSFVLSAPDTLEAALIRAAQTPGTSCMTHIGSVGSLTEPTWGVGDEPYFWNTSVSITGRSVTAVRAYTGLSTSTEYKITITLRRFEPDDTATVQIGSDEEIDVFFTPSASSGTYRFTVPAEVDADVLAVSMTAPVPA